MELKDLQKTGINPEWTADTQVNCLLVSTDSSMISSCYHMKGTLLWVMQQTVIDIPQANIEDFTDEDGEVDPDFMLYDTSTVQGCMNLWANYEQRCGVDDEAPALLLIDLDSMTIILGVGFSFEIE